MRRGRRKLSTEISSLTLLSTVSSILILGFSLVLMFLFFFSRQAREDMEYYLRNTLEQFDAKVQYIKDGAISIRHNVVMGDFFSKNHFNRGEAETQLTYCMDLFSQRNMVSQNTPLLVHVYVFNNKDDFIRSSYYPTTLSAAERTDLHYQQLQQEFRAMGEPYRCFPREGETDLCFQVLDNGMNRMGICIVTIRNDALAELFSSVMKYQGSSWLVSDSGGGVVWGNGSQEQITGLLEAERDTAGLLELEGKRCLSSSLSSGFGMIASIAVRQSNIYGVLWPMLLSFALLLVVVLAVAAVLVVGVSYRMTKPLKEMAEEIGSIGHENLSIHMKDFPIQEFHDISVVFNEMADRISHLVAQVYEKELLATRAQVKYLQAQINPHFQFNILAMFSVKAKMAGDEELYRGLRAFSKLIQGKIFREKEIKIPLSQEMELVKFYLYLQTSRFGDKISYDIRYGSQDVEGCLIPRLLIEPLVENAVSHGLEPKTGKGHILIRIFQEGDQLHILVEDDGVGFDPGETSTTEKLGHTSTGLVNTRRLLEILYGEEHEIKFSGGPGRGTRVEILLPAERGADHVEGNHSG